MPQPTPKEMLRRAREIAHELNNDEVLHREVESMLGAVKRIDVTKGGYRIIRAAVSQEFAEGLPSKLG
jgi:hypothetical protein